MLQFTLPWLGERTALVCVQNIVWVLVCQTLWHQCNRMFCETWYGLEAVQLGSTVCRSEGETWTAHLCVQRWLVHYLLLCKSSSFLAPRETVCTAPTVKSTRLCEVVVNLLSFVSCEYHVCWVVSAVYWKLIWGSQTCNSVSSTWTMHGLFLQLVPIALL